MHLNYLKARKVFGLRHGFKVWTGAHYLGGYIGDDNTKRGWLKERMYMWERKICMIRETTVKYHHEGYAAVVCVIQSEWIFL